MSHPVMTCLLPRQAWQAALLRPILMAAQEPAKAARPNDGLRGELGRRAAKAEDLIERAPAPLNSSYAERALMRPTRHNNCCQNGRMRIAPRTFRRHSAALLRHDRQFDDGAAANGRMGGKIPAQFAPEHWHAYCRQRRDIGNRDKPLTSVTTPGINSSIAINERGTAFCAAPCSPLSIIAA